MGNGPHPWPQGSSWNPSSTLQENSSPYSHPSRAASVPTRRAASVPTRAASVPGALTHSLIGVDELEQK